MRRLPTGRRARVAAAAAALAALGGLGAASWLVARHPDAGPAARPRATEDDPDSGAKRFVEVILQGYENRPEHDLVVRSILPGFGSRKTAQLPFLMGLADVTAQGTYMIFVQLTDQRFCADGCRTLAYRWNGGAWRLVADANAISVLASRDVFVYRTRSRTTAWHWRTLGFEAEPL